MGSDETLGVMEVAALLHAESETVMQYARRGDLPGARIGKSWVFMREDVLAFLRNQIAIDTEARRLSKAKPLAMIVHPAPPRGRRNVPPLLPALTSDDPKEGRD